MYRLLFLPSTGCPN